MSRVPVDPTAIDVDGLPVMALSQPPEALRAAARVLESAPSPRDRALALQASGIALRELADNRGALRRLRSAVKAAESLGGAELLSDIRSSLGMTLVFAGRTAAGLRELDTALAGARGQASARILVRRGFALQIAGRPADAIHDLRRSARTLRQRGDRVWEARAQINLAQALLDSGRAGQAAEALERAEALLHTANQPYELAIVRHNRGLAYAQLGNIPEALTQFERAGALYDRVGATPAELAFARSSALLAAGLPADALRAGEEALDVLKRDGASAAFRANALVRISDAAFASGAFAPALHYARQAERLYSRQGRPRDRISATLRTVRARRALGEHSPGLSRAAQRLARAADEHRLLQAAEANLLAGQILAEAGDESAAIKYLANAARARSHDSAINRVLGWHAAALRDSLQSRPKLMCESCERGLQTVNAYQLTFGALETRASATMHGSEIAAIALRAAIRDRDADAVLYWTERSRSTTSRLPPLRPPDDPELRNQLVALRRAKFKCDESVALGKSATELERKLRKLESEVRRRTLTESASETESTADVDVKTLHSAIGDAQLIEIVQLDGNLFVVLLDANGMRLLPAGGLQGVLDDVAKALFLLRRSARGRARKSDASMLEEIGRNLEAAVLGEAVGYLSSGRIAIAPPATLHSLPWGILPSLKALEVSVSSSGRAWATSVSAKPPRTATATFVAGPGMRSGGREVNTLAALYEGATLLEGKDATASNVLQSLDGASIAHVAAHGSFRAENPMFSSLRMADGPLLVMDLQRLARAPHRLVLSSCDTGGTAPVGSDEVLGIVTALAPLGMGGLLAPVVAIDDESAVRVGLMIHERLLLGTSMAKALQHVRAAVDDPSDRLTAQAFVSFGAA